MRILHLYSDCRWTGPAEPTVNLVSALRRMGLDVHYACRKPPRPDRDSIVHRAAAMGIEADTRFGLNRYHNPVDTARDLLRLPRFMEQQQIDIVHTHLWHDHVLGGIGARMCRRPVKVVRTNHKAVPLKTMRWHRALLRRYLDAYVGFSRVVADQDAQFLELSAEQISVINPALDLDRFYPTPAPAHIRKQFGLRPDDILVGIVARVQRHRRFEVLLEAMKLAASRAPRLRLMLIGRGTHYRRIITEPVRRMGMEDLVILAAYRRDDYVDTLRALDFKVFLMPGSDGTCRAAREAMACGKPVVASRRGMLPELIPHEKVGYVIDDSPQNLADVMVHLANDPDLRDRLGRNAAEYARRHFRLDDQARAVADLYERLARGGED